MIKYRMFQLRQWFQRLLNRVLQRNYFLSFVEEFWPGQKEGTFMGRIEVSTKEGQWELGIGTFDVDAVEQLRINYDFKTVTKKGFLKLEQKVATLNEMHRPVVKEVT